MLALIIGSFYWLDPSVGYSVRTNLYDLFLLLELGQQTIQIHFLKGINLFSCNLKQMEYERRRVTMTVLGQYVQSDVFILELYIVLHSFDVESM